jgi:hypothetical protein
MAGDFVQLGVNSDSAIYNGGLAGNSLFFGTATAEVVSVAVYNGGWNGDRAQPPESAWPWFRNGGGADAGAAAGIVTFYRHSGGAGNTYGYGRTILSGY